MGITAGGGDELVLPDQKGVAKVVPNGHFNRQLIFLFPKLMRPEAQKIVLGQKEVYKRKKGVLKPCNSTDNAYYISILDSLESLLNDEFVLEQVEWEMCYTCTYVGKHMVVNFT
jgi:hypothetical protein